MSRTDKDRPYWVKVREDGVETHYHHGRRRHARKFEKVFDADGKPIMEERIVKLTAKRVIETQPRMKPVSYAKEMVLFTQSQGFYTAIWNGVSSVIANPVYSEAQHLIAMGMPNAEVILRVDMVQKVEEVLVESSLECDYDPDAKDPWKNNCGKVLPYWMAGHSCRCSWCKPVDEPRQRTRARGFLSNMVKAANSGEDDWEDSFNELDLSKPVRNRGSWC